MVFSGDTGPCAELWRAVVPRDAAPVEAGAAVRVLEVRELTLHVEAA